MNSTINLKIAGGIAALYLLLSMLTGCGGTASSSGHKVCDTLAFSKSFVVNWEKELRKDYVDEYFETDEWAAIVDGYWRGFWEGHQYCRICRDNGDVPDKYLSE